MLLIPSASPRVIEIDLSKPSNLRAKSGRAAGEKVMFGGREEIER